MRQFYTLLLILLTTAASATFSSCTGIRRSGNALMVDGDGGQSQRMVNGRPDKVSKKWKSNSYKAKKTNNKPRKRRV